MMKNLMSSFLVAAVLAIDFERRLANLL